MTENKDLLRFCKGLLKFRRRHPALSRPEFFIGADINLNGLPDITWYAPDGTEVNWESQKHHLALRIDGSRSEIISDRDDDDFFLLFNASPKPMDFVLFPPREGKEWFLKVHTGRPSPLDYLDDCEVLENQVSITSPGRTLILLISSTRD